MFCRWTKVKCLQATKNEVLISTKRELFSGLWAFNFDRHPSDAFGCQWNRPRLHICHKVCNFLHVNSVFWMIWYFFLKITFFNWVTISVYLQKAPTDDYIRRRKSTDPGKKYISFQAFFSSPIWGAVIYVLNFYELIFNSALYLHELILASNIFLKARLKQYKNLRMSSCMSSNCQTGRQVCGSSPWKSGPARQNSYFLEVRKIAQKYGDGGQKNIDMVGQSDPNNYGEDLTNLPANVKL